MSNGIRHLLVPTAMLVIAACSEPVAPEATEAPTAQFSTSEDDACWGQTTAVFAQMGKMGDHASEFAGEPRAGLGNLARSLYDAGVIDAPTLQALAAWLADAEGLSIEACL